MDRPPHEKIYAYNDYLPADGMCVRILSYLLRLDAKTLSTERTKLLNEWIKMIYYDDSNPYQESLPIPTNAEKRAIIYNPLDPEKKGYRIFQQARIIESQMPQETQFRIYTGQIVPENDFMGTQLIVFDVWSGASLEIMSDRQSRTLAIALRTLRALNGVNIGGIGTFFFSKEQNYRCDLSAISDNKYNLGYRLVMGVNIATSSSEMG